MEVLLSTANFQGNSRPLWPMAGQVVVCKPDNARKPQPISSSEKLNHDLLIYSLIVCTILL